MAVLDEPTPEQRRHAYPQRALLLEYARAAAALPFAVAAALPMHWSLRLFCAAAAALLIGHGVRTALRQASRIVVDAGGIAVEGPRPKRIAWDRLDRLRLRYFAMRRDRRGGWMELRLAAGGERLAIESEIDGFRDIVARAAAAAAARGLALDRATQANLAAFDL